MTDLTDSDELTIEQLAERIADERGLDTFSEIFPELARVTEPILWAHASQRMRTVLRTQGNPSWHDIAEHTSDELTAPSGWRNFGRTSLRELLRRGLSLSDSTITDLVPTRSGREHLDVGVPRARDAVGSDANGAEQLLDARSHLTFAEILPELAVSPEPISWFGASERLQNVLQQQGDPIWEDIGHLTPDSLLASHGWRAFGHLSLLEMLQRGLELSAESPRKMTSELIGGSTMTQLANSLALIGSWARREHGIESLGEALELRGHVRETDVPDEVGRAFTFLTETSTMGFASLWDDDYTLGAGMAYMLAHVDLRGLEILSARELEPDRSRRPKVAELGATAGLGGTRIRQLEKQARRRILEAIDSRSGLVVERSARHLARRIGVALPIETAEVVVAGFYPLADLPGDQVPLGRNLLLWLGGPYLVADGWMVREGVKPLRDRSRQVLLKVLDAGPVEWSIGIDTIQSLGFRDRRVAEQWLEELPGFRNFGGLLVQWNRGFSDKAATVLAIRGEPMSRAELVDGIGSGTLATVGNALGSDRRFLKLDRDLFGLVEWGGDEYIGIVGLIGREIDEAGGEMRLTELVERISGRYSVASSSVTAYASNHHAFVVGDGVVRHRNEDEVAESARDVRYARRCYRLDAGWAWRTQVDHDILRGSGTPIPPGFATEAGLHPGATSSRNSEYGRINLSWTGMQPTIGSLRAVARDFDAVAGDWLFVGLIGEDDLGFTPLRARDIEAAATDAEGVALLLGVNPLTYQDDELGAIARRLGLTNRPKSFREVAGLLRARGESDLAESLPVEGSGGSISDLLDLLAD